MNILTIGAGSWGTALAVALASNNNSVKLWTKEPEVRERLARERYNKRYLPEASFPPSLSICDSIADELPKVDAVLIAVPSHGFTDILKQFSNIWPDHVGLIWATKGLEAKTGEFLHVIADKILPKINKAIITGPSFAKEVGNKKPTAVVIASESTEFAHSMKTAFQSAIFRIYLSDDMIGAQLGGAVKNVLAVATGITDGMNFGPNTRAALITRGLAELLRLGKSLGAKHDTLIGLSGLGDLILTCTDNQSRNRQFGMRIGQGQDLKTAERSVGQVVEGVKTTKIIYELSQKNKVEMPITKAMHEVLYQGVSAQEAIKKLLSRKSGAEFY